MKIAALGRTHWLYEAVTACLAKGHQVVLIGTCPAAPEYRGSEEDFARLAEQVACPFFCDAAINDSRYIKMARESGADVAVSVNWMSLIGQEMLEQFRFGVINAHAGDLPRFRGNAAPNWAILMNEPKVVLTLHQMTPSLDAGPILLQRELPLTASTYIHDVYQFIEANVSDMFIEVLDRLSAGRLVPREQSQDPADALRCYPRSPCDGMIDWHRPTEELGRLVRASAEPFAGAFSFLGSEKVIVWRARPERLPSRFLGVPGQVVEIRRRTGEVAVLTADGVLVLQEIETSSSGRRPASEIIASTRIRLGMNWQQEISRLNERVAQLEAELRSHRKS